MKKVFLSLSIGILGSIVCFAGTEKNSIKNQGNKELIPIDELFRANEFDVSVFSTVALGGIDQYENRRNSLHDAYKSVEHQAAWGGGVECDYFFSRHVGLGIEGDWLASHSAISSVSANIIGRYPIEYGKWAWAPYAFIGGGGQFDSQNAGYSQSGIGVEFRFKSHWGIFTDGRYVIHDSDLNYALLRAGIRFNF